MAAAARLTPPKATIITRKMRTGRDSATAAGIIPGRLRADPGTLPDDRPFPRRGCGSVHAHFERRHVMRTVLTLALAILVGLAAVGQAWAFSCPTLVKAANEAIAAAEPKAGTGDDRQKARNAGMIEEAKALTKDAEASHAAGKHGLSEAQAKAAKYLAEQVK